MTSKPRSALKKANSAKPAVRKSAPKKNEKVSGISERKLRYLQGEIEFLDNWIKRKDEQNDKLIGLLQKVAASFVSSVPLHEASYIHSVHISKSLMSDIYDALRGWR